MKNYSISERSLLTNVVLYNCLILILFGLFLAFLSSSFDENIRFFGSIVFAIAIGLVLLFIHGSARILANRTIEKQKQADYLEDFADHMMRFSNLSDFVKSVVDIHLKNKKSINSYQEFFFRLIGQNGKVYELFVAEIKRVISMQKEIFERSEKSHSDFNRFSFSLSSLNELLQRIVETRESGSPKFDRLCSGLVTPTIVSGAEPRVPTGCGVGISN